MKLTEERLRQIIREELLKEGPNDIREVKKFYRRAQNLQSQLDGFIRELHDLKSDMKSKTDVRGGYSTQLSAIDELIHSIEGRLGAEKHMNELITQLKYLSGN